MNTVRLDIEYDGTGFRGWARQPGLRTVQGELEAGLETVLREPVELTVAGRTDTGVHALGQVASFAVEADVPRDLARRLNGIGPDDIAVTAASVAPDGFNARHDARSRTYRYRLLARSSPSPFEQGRSLWWPHRIDREALEVCARSYPGHPRLHSLHPHANRPRSLPPQRPTGWVEAGRQRHPRLHHRGRCLHAKHGPSPRRHHARNRLIPPPPPSLRSSPKGRPPLRRRRHSPSTRLVPRVSLLREG